MSLALALAAQAAGQATSGFLGMALGRMDANWQDKRQLKQQSRLQQLQIAGQKEMMNYQQQQAYDMWLKTGPEAQKNQLKEAGLNPALMYGNGGAGGGTMTAPSGNVTGGQAAGSSGEVAQMMGLMLQNKMTASQIALNEAQAKKLDAETEKTKGVDTDEAKSRIVNNELEGIIKHYAGEEAFQQFQIKQGWRGVEKETYGTEMEYKQAMMKPIITLWEEGKLENKANWELEKIMLDNAKTREEIKNIQKQWDILEENLKGAKLSNIILELEKDLQTKTGIDKTSDGWLKILGRLFVGLTER